MTAPVGVPGTRSPARLRTRLRHGAWVLLAVTIVIQIAFPLTGGGNVALTIASVVALTAAMLCDSAAVEGVRGPIALIVIAGGGGLLAETIGVHTGVPFGGYHYTGALTPELLGVPLAVPAAWIMMAWPAIQLGRRLVRRRWPAALVGAIALTAWDLFLDPQMVDAGYWVWHHPSPTLPGVSGIPLTNFGGWLLVSSLMMTALTAVLPQHDPPRTQLTDSAAPIAYLWTYFSSVIAHLVFFGRPPVALVGGLIMGVVAVPLAISVIGEVRRARR